MIQIRRTDYFMTLEEGKQIFITEWGKLGSSWGVSKTMAHIHAYLLISKDLKNADHIKEELGISSGNVNTNLKMLVEWGLIFKNGKDGCRKDYYVAEKEMWKIFTQIIINRKKRELDPLVSMLNQISCVEGLCEKSEEFCKVVSDVKLFSERADKALDNLSNNRSRFILSGVMKMMG